MTEKYILDEAGNPVPEPDIVKWGTWFQRGQAQDPEHMPRRVALSEVDGYRVSTVFLGMDHSFGHGPPVLWETLVAGEPPWDGWMDRYTSRADAEAGHHRICELILAGQGPPDD